MKAASNGVARRDRYDIFGALLHRLPGYTPELSPAAQGTARAVMEVFSRYMELLHAGLAQVPNRSFLAFLEMMGVELLAAEAARVPLVFTLIDDSPADVTLPAGSQVAALPTPPPPSLVEPANESPDMADPILFATEQTVTLSRGKLTTLYSIVPGSDTFADHSARLTTGFSLFGDLRPTEHAIYLGHDHLFALAGEIAVILAFSFGHGGRDQPPAGRDGGMKVIWEYLTDSGWLPFENLPEEDTTGGLRMDGQMTLRRACGPDARKQTFEGRTSYWLRGRLATPLLPLETAGLHERPIINDIRASVSFGKKDLLPEAAFNDAAMLDVTRPFFPFGQQPVTHSVFYVASKEVFQRKGARISFRIDLSQAGGPLADTSVALDWEYSAGAGWQRLFKADTEIAKFRTAGTLSFTCPADWAEVNVNGVKNYWLRVRISSGQYGSPVGVTVTGTGTSAQFTPTPSSLTPPIISRLGLSYAYVTDPEPLDHCLAHNDFVFEDHSEACRWPDQTFMPFQLVADRHPAVHFGFDRPLPVGLVGLYVDVPETAGTGLSSSPFVWEYRSARGWTEIGVIDETAGFRRSGMVQFVGPSDAIATDGLGESLYRIRARLKSGERIAPLPIGGVWLNAVWASHSRTFEQEPLGTSDGNPGQTFSARRTPVLTAETLEVQEWTGRGEYWRTFVQNVSDRDLRLERDAGAGDVIAVWVRWTRRPHLHDSGPADRHYVIERARGLVGFGDDHRGLIPPAGRRITLSYRSGGGLAGNVPAGAISELRTAVPFVMGATNPVAALGGAAIESLVSVAARGPLQPRHRGRAISPQDCEWIARDASPEVARARCLPIAGPDGRAQRGWVTVVIVPHSAQAQPRPSVELLRRVHDYLSARVPASVARRVRVVAPRYVAVSIAAELVPLSAPAAALVEARVRARLGRFLHPLTGGVTSDGWDFGATVHLSHIASVIEGTEGVDFASEISLNVGGCLFSDSVPIGADALIASGDHELKLTVGVA